MDLKKIVIKLQNYFILRKILKTEFNEILFTSNSIH